MYLPPRFKSDDRDHALALMRNHSFASPISPDDSGLPYVTHLPLHGQDEGPELVLLGHVAQPNPHRRFKKLIGDHEPAYVAQWRGLGEDYAHKMRAGIVAFEPWVTALQCKLKLNQRRREAHAAMKTIYAAGSENERALAACMDTLGLHGH